MPSDRQWGIQNESGHWTGIVGQLHRKVELFQTFKYELEYMDNHNRIKYVAEQLISNDDCHRQTAKSNLVVYFRADISKRMLSLW